MPREQEEIINNMLREYKINAITFNTEKVLAHTNISIDTTDYITIPVYPNDYKRHGGKLANKKKKLEKSDRAKTKQQTKKLIEEYERGGEEWDL